MYILQLPYSRYTVLDIPLAFTFLKHCGPRVYLTPEARLSSLFMKFWLFLHKFVWLYNGARVTFVQT